MKFSIQFLAASVIPFAVMAFCIINLNSTSFFVGCIAIPILFAFIFRIYQNSHHVLNVLLIVILAVTTGAILMGYGSYHQTFTQKAKGYLVGEGWNSVYAATIFGGALGLPLSILSIAIYYSLVAAFKFASTPEDRN